MKQLVITVHGIRTFGDWQGRLANLLQQQAKDRELKVIEYKFGFFSIAAFMVPFVRMLAVRRFRKYFVNIATTNTWDRIDLVGHSFGTYVIAWALRRINSARPPQANTIIFAGSVLKTNFPWQDLIGRSVKRLINDCGIKDGILVLNQIVILGTGMAGRLGFNGGIGDNFRNRYFDCGHSGFFFTDDKPDDAFIKRYWVPLLLDEGPPELVDVRKGGALSGVALWLLNNSDPVKLFAILLPLAIAGVHYYRLEQEAVTQRNNAETERAEAQRNLVMTENLLDKLSDLVAERLKPITKLGEVDKLVVQATGLIGEAQRNDPGMAIPYARMLLTEAAVNWERRGIQEMKASANQALDVLSKSDQTKPEVQHLLAQAKQFVALYFTESALGEPNAQTIQDDLNKAVENYKSALDKLLQLKSHYQSGALDSDWRWLRSLGQAQMAMGDLLLLGFANPDEADKSYRQARDTWTVLLSDKRVDDKEITYELDWTDNKLADALRAEGEDAAALGEYQNAEREIKSLIDKSKFDTDPKWQNFLAVVQNNVAIEMTARGQYDGAVQELKNAQDYLNAVLNHDPNQTTWESNLDWTRDNIVETTTRWARNTRDASRLREEDKDLLEQAVRDLKKLIETSGNTRWNTDVAVFNADLEAYQGTKLELAHDCGGAAEAYARAAAANPTGVKDGSADTVVLRKAEFLEWAAIDYRKSGNEAEAKARLLEAKSTIDGYVPRFSGRAKLLAEEKQQIEQYLQATTQPGQNVCN